MEFIQHSNFTVNHDHLNHDIFWKDKIYTSNIDLQQLANDFISQVRVKRYFEFLGLR